MSRDDEAFFVVIFPVVQELHGKRLVEHALSEFKTNSVFSEVILWLWTCSIQSWQSLNCRVYQ